MSGKITKKELSPSLNEELDKIGLLQELNSDIEAQNLVEAINYVYDDTKIRFIEITSLVSTSISEGAQAKLTWINPPSNDFLGVEIYVSTNDISDATYEYANTNLTRILNSNTTEITYNTTKNMMYYFKVFTKYDVFGEIRITTGKSVSVFTEDKTPPNPITNFQVTKEDDRSVSLSWVNPINPDFNKTKIMYKVGSYPTSPTDGNVAYEGSGRSAVVNGLTNNILHYFRAFTIDNSNNINSSTTGMQITGTPTPVKIYGVRIDMNNSNPNTSVIYTDDATGMTGGSSSWDSLYPYNEIAPVLYQNGVEVSELNKNDFSKTLTGASVDITSGNAGDVMIKFPTIWWKINRTGSFLDVKYATKQVDSSWKALGHTRGNTVKEYCYIGAYLGNTISGKLRSLSGKAPTVSQTIGTFRNQAKANGANYDQIGYFQILMLQILYLIRYKSLDSQTALGRGYVDGNGSATTTGNTNVKGMYFGETTGKQQMKFAGIEDFWGNCFYWVDGLFNDSSRNILIGTENFNDTGAGYVNYGQGSTANLGGYTSDVQGGTETGFIVKATAGSATTYFADYGYLGAGYLPRFGGSWTAASDAGAFDLRVDFSASNAVSSLAARLLAL